MRTDLTVRDDAGTDRDIAVLAPAGTTWGAVRDALPRAASHWCGRRALDAATIVGVPPLVHGAIVSSTPPPRREVTGARLEVVGGRDAGTGVALRRCPVLVGRDPSCDLVLNDPQVSRCHARITASGARVTIVDLGSTSGTRVDGRAVATAVLTPGALIRIGDSFLSITTPADHARAVDPDGEGALVVACSAATPTRPAADTVRLPDPPLDPTGGVRLPVLASLIPAVLGAGLAAFTGSWEFLAFAALMPLAGLAAALAERRQVRRAGRRAWAAYHDEVGVAERAIAAGLAAERVHRRRAYLDPAALLRAATTPTHRLWSGDDRLRVRVGLGTRPSELTTERAGEHCPAGMATDVPVTVDLAAGLLGIVGPRDLCCDLARWLIAQVAVLGSPAQVEIAPVDAVSDNWRWTRWLPHRRAGPPPPGHDGVAVVVRGGSRPTGIVTADRLSDLPRGCAQVIVAGEGGTVRVQAPDGDACEAVADRVGAGWADQVARALAALRPGHREAGAAIGRECRLLDLVGERALTPSAVRAGWDRSTGSAATVLGVDAAGPLLIDLERDGPHALVAGSTGAGKSELLQTLVAGLALAHPPSELSFLLIDYKGGAAFAECADLPHTVGLVTDLDEHLTRRVLTSLDSEVRRRERLLADAGAHDLAAYRTGPRVHPLARLVIIVDEFAALAEEVGDFVPGLVGIARRGRSLGLHLVLATQRPSGVVSPEIRANTALRICLRVTSATESLDVVDSAAAAGIAPGTPGRGYVCRGDGTSEFQTARVAVVAPAGAPDAVRVVRLDRWRCPVGGAPVHRDTDLRRIVLATRAAAALAPEPPAPHRPWVAALPANLDAEVLDAPADVVPIGLIDLPAQQRQAPLVLDLTTGAAVMITGRARSGRSTALRTIALAAAARFSAADLHIYAIDATGSGLADLRALPHVGTVATTADGFDLTARLVERLGAASSARMLLLVDGWDQVVAAAEEYDGGRTVERLLALVQNVVGGTVVVAGGRATLSPRVAALGSTRLVLALGEPGEYAVAGVPSGSIPPLGVPGRGVRVEDGAQFQFAVAADPVVAAEVDATDAVRIVALPRTVSLSALPRGDGLITLGVCGDEATPARIDLVGRSARALVAGPPRSGRSTALCCVLVQARASPCVVIAPARSPLTTCARRAGVAILAPGGSAHDLPDEGLVLIDDLETITDTALEDAICTWADADLAGRALVAAARTDTLAVGYRGLLAQLRHARCGVLLNPGPGDGDLLGVAVPRTRSPRPPGRGLLVPDPAWGLGAEAMPIQVACCDEAQPMCG